MLGTWNTFQAAQHERQRLLAKGQVETVDLHLFQIAGLGFESLQLGLFESDSHKWLTLFILWKKEPGYFQGLLMLFLVVSLPAEKGISCGLECFNLRGNCYRVTVQS